MSRAIGFLAGLNYIEYEPELVVKTLAGQGYKAVSWPLPWFDSKYKSHDECQKLVNLTTERGLIISEWVVQLDYISLDTDTAKSRVDHTIEILQRLAELDVRAPVNLFTGPAPWDPTSPKLGKELSEGSAWDLVFSAFDRILPIAENTDQTIAVETVFGHLVHDYYSLQELLHHYQSDRLCVNYDPSHGILYGNDTPWVIKQLGKQIVHVHLKDAVGKAGGLPGDTFEFPLIGEGQVPWCEMFSALDEIDYQGPMSVEFETFNYYKNVLRSDPAAASKLSMDILRIIMDRFQSIKSCS